MKNEKHNNKKSICIEYDGMLADFDSGLEQGTIENTFKKGTTHSFELEMIPIEKQPKTGRNILAQRKKRFARKQLWKAKALKEIDRKKELTHIKNNTYFFSGEIISKNRDHRNLIALDTGVFNILIELRDYQNHKKIKLGDYINGKGKLVNDDWKYGELDEHEFDSIYEFSIEKILGVNDPDGAYWVTEEEEDSDISFTYQKEISDDVLVEKKDSDHDFIVKYLELEMIKVHEIVYTSMPIPLSEKNKIDENPIND